MSLEDPFFVVKDEVLKALEKTRELFDEWKVSEKELRSAESREWSATELRNSLRSIEWDLEDLDDTVQIVEKNPTKFRIDSAELTARKQFIRKTRQEVQSMKDRTTISKTSKSVEDYSPTVLDHVPLVSPKKGSTRYSRLNNEEDDDVGKTNQSQQQQRLWIESQDESLSRMGDSVGNLRNMSQTIGNELDEQAVMLDEFGTEIENAESKLDATMRKMAKVLHMSNDRRQWMAIGVLSSAMVVIILMLFI